MDVKESVDFIEENMRHVEPRYRAMVHGILSTYYDEDRVISPRQISCLSMAQKQIKEGLYLEEVGV